MSREVFLSLQDVEELIRELENQYGLTSADFLRDPVLRASVPEDDAFRWYAFIDHRRELREIHEQVHSQYISSLTRPTGESAKSPTPEDQVLLAA